MRCLVTGASGLIGARLVRLLLEQNCDVAVLLRAASDPWRIQEVLPRLEVISGDLHSVEASAPDIRRFAPEVVFHLGWQGASREHRQEAQQVRNLNGSVALLEMTADAGCTCWVGVGSQAEYGPYNQPLTEDLPARPNTMYGAVKLATGLILQQLCAARGIRLTWLRLLAAYGPTEDEAKLIPHVILSLLRRQTPALSSGEQFCDYLYSDDAAEAIWQTAACTSMSGVFVLASGRAYTVREIAEMIRDQIDPALALGFGQRPENSLPLSLQADISRFQKATGWVAQVPLDKGLARTIDWFRNRLRGRS